MPHYMTHCRITCTTSQASNAVKQPCKQELHSRTLAKCLHINMQYTTKHESCLNTIPAVPAGDKALPADRPCAHHRHEKSNSFLCGTIYAGRPGRCIPNRPTHYAPTDIVVISTPPYGSNSIQH